MTSVRTRVRFLTGRDFWRDPPVDMSRTAYDSHTIKEIHTDIATLPKPPHEQCLVCNRFFNSKEFRAHVEGHRVILPAYVHPFQPPERATI